MGCYVHYELENATHCGASLSKQLKSVVTFLQLLKTVLFDFAKNVGILTLSGLSNSREDWSVRELWTIIAYCPWGTPEQREERSARQRGQDRERQARATAKEMAEL